MRQRRFTIAFAGLLGFAVVLAAPRAPAPQNLSDMVTAAEKAKQGDGLFGSIEIEAGSLKGLVQWTRVLSVMRRDAAAFDNCVATASACTTSVLKQWRNITTTAAPLSPRVQIKAVNDFFNRWPYKLDRELYGVREYWATPKEFLSRSGDCEDYAIAKYFALRKLGFGKDKLRVVVLRDRIRGIGHAILAVYIDDDILILDNLSKLLLSHKRYGHYVPLVSVNETTRWAHVGTSDRPEASSSVFRPPKYRRGN